MAVVAVTPPLSTVIWVVPGLRAVTVPVTGSTRATRGSLDDQRWEAGSAMGRVTVARLSPKLYPKLQAEGPFTADTVAEIHRKLAHALRAA
jgi:hypothetical protein